MEWDRVTLSGMSLEALRVLVVVVLVDFIARSRPFGNREGVATT